ncbi:ComF family protein [Snuella sedimenti]|uniref:ComF family protein n=1 Tax=Snuella sedimenti TaxID=2798802 RepID=A0A8J7IGF3_9FLAO|nr:phosphoribosyltransferase family protein [Snuella sedimenti]MBJ6369107.1 ComF family protein [Snuella sedimenti]
MFKSLVNLFFPKVCYACLNLLQDNEETICVDCRHALPVTNFHLNNDDTVLKVFYGRVKVAQATALLRFEKKGIVQQLIHGLKYKGYESVGVVLGQWLGNELKTIPAYNTIDMVIPVPLHKSKLRKRGYNQVAKFGACIAEALDSGYSDNVLVKKTNITSQVTKKRFARWQNNEAHFTLQNTKTIENKHILLVDDIITTGATLEACITVLNQAQNVKISVATMAIA